MSKKWIVGAAIVVALAAPTALRAHGGHAHKIMGTVTAVHEKHVEIETKDGRKVTVALTEKTRILKGKAKASATDLEEGALVVVEAEGEKQMTAKSITIGTGRTPTKQ